MTTPQPVTVQRLPALDALKGAACVLIVLHHLAFYGPMSDVLHRHVPWLTAWLYDYGRMAVQVFLVVAGFLAAASLAPDGTARFERPARLILQRYLRLVPPYLVAVAATVLVAALVRPWFDHSSVPAAPTLLQIVAHALLLQDLLGYDALSAGVWYVAIDLQLFTLAVLTLAGARGLQRGQAVPWAWLPVVMVALLGTASLLVFNRYRGLDATALYFFGSYALGMLAFWVSSQLVHTQGGAQAITPMARSAIARRWMGVALVLVIGGSALAINFRPRIAIALVTALGLIALRTAARPAPVINSALHLAPADGWWTAWLRRSGLVRIGQMAYSIFLIHFSVCLLVNAAVTRFWPKDLLPNALGLVAAFGLSLLAGAALYRGVEARPIKAPGLPLPVPVER